MVALLDGAEREHTCVPHRCIAGRAGYRSWLLVVLVVVAVAHRSLASSSVTTSTMDRALLLGVQSALERPPTTTRLPLAMDSAARPGSR